MTITDRLSKLRIVLARSDEECTKKAGTARRLLQEVDAHLLNLHMGRTEESAIDIGALKERVSLYMKSMNTDLRPCGRRAKLHVRRIRNFQLQPNGEPLGVTVAGEGGLTFWDLDTKQPISDVSADKNVLVPERATLQQNLWRLPVKGNRDGYFIFSDSSDKAFSKAAKMQFAPPLINSPESGCEIVDLTSLTKEDIIEIITDEGQSRDLFQKLTDYGVELEDFGLTSRRLRDVDTNSDPGLAFLSVEQKSTLSADLESAGLSAVLQLQAAKKAGLWSTSLGPTANGAYSDYKKILLSDGEIVVNMPLICYGTRGFHIAGVPKRDGNGGANIDNRLDDGRCYIIDMGGIDPVIRKGKPNPLPAHRFAADGPDFAFPQQGALMRYKGGKCLAVNTTGQDQVISTTWFDSTVHNVTVPSLTAIWKLDFGSFTFAESGVPGVELGKKGGSAGFYTVFAASRAPASGFMGVPLAPRYHKFGRGKDVTASGVTLANGVSTTGQPFKNQDADGNMLSETGEITTDISVAASSTLKGVTGGNNGHGMDLVMLLKELEKRGKVRGVDYLTQPAAATSSSSTVQDVLIPAGKEIPRVTNAVATLVQFANGVFVPNGGPAFFQPGVSPFLAGVPAYTPQWHINFLFFNCGGTDSGPNCFQPAKSPSFADWAQAKRNPSLSGPGPAPVNASDPNAGAIAAQLSSIGYNPADPDTFDPVQMANGIKGRHCPDYICSNFSSSVEHRIPVSEIPKETETNANNTILVTEAPAGARQGWVKFLIVNCPLPVVVDFETSFLDDDEVGAILAES